MLKVLSTCTVLAWLQPNMIEIDVEKLMKDVMIPLDPIPVPRGNTRSRLSSRNS